MSEREKLYIAVRYYAQLRGETASSRRSSRSGSAPIRRDSVPYDYLGIVHSNLGQYEQALAEHREEVALSPTSAFAVNNLAYTYVYMNRLEEARAVTDQAFQEADRSDLHFLLYQIAFLQGDDDGLRRELEQAKGRPDEGFFRLAEARTLVARGRLRQAREVYSQAVAMAERAGFKEQAAAVLLDQATTAAACGEDARTREGVRAALATSRGGYNPMIAAHALALAGFAEEARSLLDEVARQFPVNTLIQTIGLPTARAACQLRAGNPAGAIELLEEPKRYELGVAFVYLPVYVRGLACLRAGAGADARGAFQRIVDNPGVDPLSVLRPLAQLGLAR